MAYTLIPQKKKWKYSLDRKNQLMRYSYKGNSVSLIREYNRPGLFEVGIFYKNGQNYAERFLTKEEAIKLYRYYKRMIKGLL